MKTFLLSITVFIAFFVSEKSYSQSSKVTLGAYYFDGWTGRTYHVNSALRDSFQVREPVWGWVTSTPEAIKDQINLAADNGLNFFDFCWYYKKGVDINTYPLNNAVNLYLKAPNKERLKFCVLVANHSGFPIGPSDWQTVTSSWINLFKDPSYLKVDGKPLISFIDVQSLVQQFGSPEKVHQALDSLRMVCKQSNLEGVTIAGCVSPNDSALTQAANCGFDYVTGYHYRTAGFSGRQKVIPIDSLIHGSIKIWDQYLKSPLPYIPIGTLNWDPRPWASESKSYATSPYYVGYSESSTYNAVSTLRHWMDAHPSILSKNKVAILYAWNEYGEGAWLTPSKEEGTSLLQGVKKATDEK